jgi:hypothetical protein
MICDSWGGKDMETWLTRHRRVVVVMVAILALLGASWVLFASGVKQALQRSLAEHLSQHVNGRIQIGDVDLTLIGWVRITDVSLHTNKDVLLAKIPVVEIQYSWSDLAKGNFDSSRILAIKAEGAEVWLQEEAGQWNWEGFLNDDPTNKTEFQGKVQVTSAKIYGYASLGSKTIDDVNGVIDLQAFPDMDISLSGKIGQGFSTANGKWVKGRFARIVVQARDLDLREFRDSIPAAHKIVLEGGKVPTVTVTTERDELGVVKWNAEGEFSGVKLTGKVDISEGQGQFKGNQDGLQLQNMKLVAAGQQLEGQGTLSWPQDTAKIDVVLTIPDADPGAFALGLTIQRPVACRIRIVGDLAEPNITGSFSFPQVTVSDMTIGDVAGNFWLDGSRLLLQDVSGNVYQGTIWIAGEVQRSSGSYELEASGQGLDSSRLTDKDVQGPLEFSAHVSGQGEAAVTQGTFIIHNGKAYGIPFLTLTGHFVKRGAVTEISGIIMKTALGTFYPEQLSRDALTLLIQQSPANLVEKAIRNESGDIIKKEAGNLIQRILR